MCFMTKESSDSKSIIKVPKSAIYKDVMKMWKFFFVFLYIYHNFQLKRSPWGKWNYVHAIPLSIMRYFVYGVLQPMGKQNLISSILSFFPACMHGFYMVFAVAEKQKRNLMDYRIE